MEGGLINPLALIRTGAAEGVTSRGLSVGISPKAANPSGLAPINPLLATAMMALCPPYLVNPPPFDPAGRNSYGWLILVGCIVQ
jgi:hypothetical protein